MKINFNKNFKSIFAPIICGIILAGLGVGLMLMVPNKKGQAVTQYNMTWEAGNLMIGGANLKFSDPARYDIPIGVTKWIINGTYGSKTFHEEWNTFPYNDSYPNGGWLTSEPPNENNWIFGYIRPNGVTDNQLRASVKIDGDVNHTPSASITPLDAVALGRAARCKNEDCIYATGPYSFAIGHEINSSGFRPWFFGTLMPLKWQVTGSISD